MIHKEAGSTAAVVKPGTLYVVATPIGNLEDVTLRSLHVLGKVDLVAAEDTRHTRRLLERYNLQPSTISYHAHSAPGRRDEIVRHLAAGAVALVTDAGTPGISDPGVKLVDAAWQAGYSVVAIPGPSAVAAALSIAGFPADRYVFVGFLPRKSADRRATLRAALETGYTVVAFESPHRLAAAMKDLSAIDPEQGVAVLRELTKVYEEAWRGTARAAADHWAASEVRGEITLVLAPVPKAEPRRWSDEEVRGALEALRAEGCGAKEASRELAPRANRPAREIYALWDHDA